MASLAKLEAASALTMALVFGVVAGILGLVLWFSGYSGSAGLALALVLSVVLVAIQWWFSPAILKLIMRLEEAKPSGNAWLYSTVDKLTKEARIPMPKLYIVQNTTPNAFAFGRTQKSAGIAVHTGLLSTLDKPEVEAVLAHEVGHIKHRDMIVMTVASILPVMLYYIVIVLGARGRDGEGRQGSSLPVFLGALFARFLGTFLVMWLSRTREYYADEFSAHITKTPRSLMSALSKISYGISASPMDGGAVRAFYIADPETTNQNIPMGMSVSEIEAAVKEDKARGFMEVFMTHPLTSKRLLNLKRLEAGGA